MREAARAAAQRLTPCPDEDAASIDFIVESFATAISAMVNGAENPDTREPRRAGPVRVEAEVTALSKQAAKLRQAIATISLDTVQALWDAPSLRTDDGEPYRVNVRQTLDRLLIDLGHLQAVAKHAPVNSGMPEMKVGERADLWVASVIKVTAWHYEKITGRVIDQSRGPSSFHVMISETFASLGIKRSIAVAVRDAKRKAWT